MRSIHMLILVVLTVSSCSEGQIPVSSEDGADVNTGDDIYDELLLLIDISLDSVVCSGTDDWRIARTLARRLSSPDPKERVIVLKSLSGFEGKWSCVARPFMCDKNTYVRLSAARVMVENGYLEMGLWPSELNAINALDARCYYSSEEVPDITRLVSLEVSFVQHRLFPNSQRCLNHFKAQAVSILEAVDEDRVFEEVSPFSKEVSQNTSFCEVVAVLNLLAESLSYETYQIMLDFDPKRSDIGGICLARLFVGAVIRDYSLQSIQSLFVSHGRLPLSERDILTFLNYKREFQEKRKRMWVLDEDFFLSY